MHLRRACLFGLVAATLVSLSSSPAPAEGEAPYEENVAPLYLIISFDDTFITNKHPSQTIMVNIGSLAGGNGILDTRFIVDTALTTIELPDGRRDPTFEELSDNSATLVGSFKTTDLDEVHMVTPVPGDIPADVQAAVFAASNEGLLDDLLLEDPFPKTTEIADVIMTKLPAGSTINRATLLSHLFNSGQPLSMSGFGASVVGEGEMFPHDPEAVSLFEWRVEFAEDGTFESDVCLLVGVDVLPGNPTNPVNVASKNGELSIAILASSDFAATQVVLSSIHIGGVAPTKSILRDADSDHDDDVVLHWDVEDLVDAGVLTTASTSVTVEAVLLDGACIKGTGQLAAK